MDPSIRECWTRNAYFRAAINFSVSLVDQIERETQWANEEIVRYAAEQSSNRAAFEKQLRQKIARQAIKSEGVHLSRQTQLDEEADHSKRIDQDIRKRFPLSTLDEQTESQLRITLRSRLQENLRGLENGFYTSNPSSPSCMAASQSALLGADNAIDAAPQRAGLYFIPRDSAFTAVSTSCTRTSQETDAEPSNVSQKDLDIAQLEYSMRQRSDMRQEAFLDARISYFRETLDTLESQRRTLEAQKKSDKKNAESIKFYKRELKTAEETRRNFVEERDKRNEFNSSRLSELRKRVLQNAKKMKNQAKKSHSQKLSTAPTLTARKRSPIEQQIVSIIRKSLTKDTLTRMTTLNNDHHPHPYSSSAAGAAEETPLPAYGLMHFMDLPLSEDSYEMENQIRQFLWPSELEQSIPHVLTGWCKPVIYRSSGKIQNSASNATGWRKTAANLAPAAAATFSPNSQQKKWRPILLTETDVLYLQRVESKTKTLHERRNPSSLDDEENRSKNANGQPQQPQDGNNLDWMLSKTATYGSSSRRPILPGEAKLSWLSIKGVGDFVSSVTSLKGCELD